MKVRVSLGILDSYAINGIHGFAERLSQILPGNTFHGEPSRNAPGHGAGTAEVMVRIALALQLKAGLSQTFWKVSHTGIAGTYDIAFGCANENTGEYLARAAFRIVRAALHGQRYSLAPDVNMLRYMTENSGHMNRGRKNLLPTTRHT